MSLVPQPRTIASLIRAVEMGNADEVSNIVKENGKSLLLKTEVEGSPLLTWLFLKNKPLLMALVQKDILNGTESLLSFGEKESLKDRLFYSKEIEDNDIWKVIAKKHPQIAQSLLHAETLEKIKPETLPLLEKENALKYIKALVFKGIVCERLSENEYKELMCRPKEKTDLKDLNEYLKNWKEGESFSSMDFITFYPKTAPFSWFFEFGVEQKWFTAKDCINYLKSNAFEVLKDYEDLTEMVKDLESPQFGSKLERELLFDTIDSRPAAQSKRRAL